ncbi:50S ribosomal protein L10 [Candidatus Pacearchaeota archaeon]|nr:50S ribosomal protein L10 [Candidatus Pacearchaeota archaeon]
MAEQKQKSKTNQKGKLKYRENPIPESKKQKVRDLTNLINNKRTILIASIKNLPAAQLQEITKKFRGKAVLRVPKKSLFFRALEKAQNEKVKKLKDYFENSVAVLFSDEDSFDISADLLKSKSPAKAKPGQEAPEDIEVQEGPTDLMPGPAISELGAVGIQIKVEKGKIAIREPKVIVKEGEEISQEVADVMGKLDIKPFSIGLIPMVAFDNNSKTLYAEIKINSEEAVKELKNAYGRALPFAVEIGYTNSETVKFMLGKAGSYEKVLVKLIEEKGNAGKSEKDAEKKKSDKEEEKEEKKSESKESESSEEKAEEAKESKNDSKESEDKNQTPENKSEKDKESKEEGKPEKKSGGKAEESKGKESEDESKSGEDNK